MNGTENNWDELREAGSQQTSTEKTRRLPDSTWELVSLGCDKETTDGMTEVTEI